ncbi:hypothetical protein FGE12_29415 [Aggregicoccus sp. 17bor-14]|uniref:MSCRAMM family protein n=1 Tax=Myxococcaceae TaxID=31 RepID=UPI00129CE531|nr:MULTISPECIES: carboxypeptidase-like regulatory domain-containing protein [Myxococcaceae]MBF5046572.1 carboxypeptidase regulatory-like domain-containing protein [Simulacricoccus sp. 17bor-14]MRI92283.1 hypothetical protein [Aggregicoccus sp. 17bor-14]
MSLCRNVGSYFLLAMLGVLAGCSRSEPVAMQCPAGFVAEAGVCVEAVGRVSGTATYADQTAHGGISVLVLGTDQAATTAEDGAFTLSRLPPGTYALEARSPGYGPQRSSVTVSAGASATAGALRLERLQPPPASTARLQGKVLLDGASTDSAGVQVYLEGTGHVAFSASNGDFLLEGIAPGTYALSAQHLGFGMARVGALRLEAGQTVDVGTLRLAPVGNASGAVTGQVQLVGANDHGGVTVFLAGTSLSALSAADGSFTLAPVLPGTYTLVMAKPGYVTRSSAPFLAEAGQSTRVTLPALAPLDASSSPFGRVVGRVTRAGAASGNAGSLVYLEGTDRITYTDETGAFLLGSVVPGNYALVAAANGFTSQRQEALAVAAGGDTVAPTLDLERVPAVPDPVGSVHGQVLLGDARADLANTTVFLSGTSYVGYTDAEGHYSLTGVLPGTYPLVAMRVGYEPARAEGVVVTVGQVASVPTLTLAPGAPAPGAGAVEGSAFLLGAPSHAGITAKLLGPEGTALLTTTTDAAGRYAFASVPGGIYALTLTAPGFAEARLENVVAASGVFRPASTTLRRGTRLDARPLYRAVFTPAQDRAVLNFVDGGQPSTYAYEVGTGGFVTLANTMIWPFSFDATGTYASVQAGTSMMRSNLRTGALDAVTPAGDPVTQAWQLPAELVLRTSAGDLYTLRPDSTVGELLATRPCPAVALGPQVTTQFARGAGSTWYQVDFGGNCAGANGQYRILHRFVRQGGVASGWFEKAYVSPSGTWALALAVDDVTAPEPWSWTLQRIDFAQGTVTPLVTAVTTLFVAPDLSFARVGHAPERTSTLLSYSAVAPATGAVTLLAEHALISDVDEDGRRALVSTLAPAEVRELRFDAATSVTACPGALVVANPEAALCNTGNPGVLTGYDRRSRTARVLSTQALRDARLAGDGATWSEAEGPRGARVGTAGESTPFCTGDIWIEARVSTNGHVWAGYCAGTAGIRSLVVDLERGAVHEVMPGPKPSDVASSSPGFSLTAQGNLVAFTWTQAATTTEAWRCTADAPSGSGCTAFYDLRTRQRLVVPGNYELVAQGPGELGAYARRYEWYLYTARSLHVQFGPGTPRVLTLDPLWTDGRLGADGRWGLMLSSEGNEQTLLLTDAQLGTKTVLERLYQWDRPPLDRIGTGNTYRGTTFAVDLDSGVVTNLEAGARDFRASADGFTYVTGQDVLTLHAFREGSGLSTLLTGVHAAVPPAYAWPPYARPLFVSDADGALSELNPGAGTVRSFGTGFAPEVRNLDDVRTLALHNVDLTGGDLVLLDFAAGKAVDLHVRVRRPVNVYAASAERLLVASEDADGRPSLSAVRLDGSGARRLGPEARQAGFSADGSRALFSAAGLFWVENPAGASFAIDSDLAYLYSYGEGNHAYFSRDARHILYSLASAPDTEPQRSGTFRVDLP